MDLNRFCFQIKMHITIIIYSVKSWFRNTLINLANKTNSSLATFCYCRPTSILNLSSKNHNNKDIFESFVFYIICNMLHDYYYTVTSEEILRNYWPLLWSLTNKMIGISLQNAQKCIGPDTFTSLEIFACNFLHAVDVHVQMLYFVCNLKVILFKDLE